MSAATVLIADNDHAVNGLLGELIGRHGHRVVAAYDGEEAQARLRAGGVSLLICDLDMPKLDGLEVLEWLSGRGCVPPALVVSGYLNPATEERLRALPFVRGLYQKPFDLLAFGDAVNELLAVEGGAEQAGERQAEVP